MLSLLWRTNFLLLNIELRRLLHCVLDDEQQTTISSSHVHIVFKWKILQSFKRCLNVTIGRQRYTSVSTSGNEIEAATSSVPTCKALGNLKSVTRTLPKPLNDAKNKNKRRRKEEEEKGGGYKCHQISNSLCYLLLLRSFLKILLLKKIHASYSPKKSFQKRLKPQFTLK